ncbi:MULTISPECIES: type I-E CRISPR-associated protein Cas6/Cse3/CasE [unclassified Rothia (in: high G+C Gram-positive bacteria)]|uniref:type I-E CRISPR-associated protein Cas6/Cse3/CasE n=1 Tax=unclassified Rothia (in: high G+C Gram-positive bacteria) TaxID=2689056 RepID=UPI00195A1835|nr:MULTISPECIES: type I-E CRISPR-associated protein Cas6/Cse3/CasE [unclassified Rothia (in: high G+C Gram-positive bacteria)]MBM7052132.1 type I-E CRISPR-associated protein Cas6/Cse3/CasE [Rothia sp. ZJ1223]QRZ61434.1 type I-E CRISPR-associated protein Cas6/Cse3/CasE [Rothia sp. ZJ932]
MTYFSRILLNPQRREARKLIASPQAMHAAVLASFPPDSPVSKDSRVLWRLDIQGASYTLYIQSPEEPDLRHLQESSGWESRPGETAPLGKLLNKLEKGQSWGFRFTGNPVKSLPVADGKRGKVVPHVTAEQQLGWLLHKAEQWGFTIAQDPETAQPLANVIGRNDQRFSRRNPHEDGALHSVTLRQAQFDGVLVITDVDLFKKSLLTGMGKGKAYGCGLLTLRNVLS